MTHPEMTDVQVQAPGSSSPRYHFMAQHRRLLSTDFVLRNPITWSLTPQEQLIFNETCNQADRNSQFAYKQWCNGLLLNAAYNLGKYRSPLSLVTAWGIPILLAADLAAQSVPVWQGYREMRMLPCAESDFNQRGYRFRHFALARMFSVSSEEAEVAASGAGAGVAEDEVARGEGLEATTWRRWGMRWGKFSEQA